MVGHRRERERHEQREGRHEAQLETEQLELPSDQEAAADEDRVGHDHPRAERDPPQVLRLGVLRAQRDESEHEAEVRRVEDVAALPADQVLGRHRDGDHGDKDPDPVHAPPLAVQRPWHAEDERRAVAGEQTAGRPQDHLVLEEADAELDQRADREADQDLGDREPEVEHCLAQGLQREEDRGDVEAWVANAWQKHRVGAPEET